jgi:large subunit ribosomal protein L25
MEKATLRALRREGIGSSAARRTRRDGAIPGVLYGAHEQPTPIQIDAREFSGLIKQGLTDNTLINLLLDDEKKSDRLTLIREVQRDPVRNDLRHVDFVHVDVKVSIEVEVPVHLIGTADGVRNQGGILEQRLHEIEIKCLPTEIPSAFELDVSALTIGDSLHVSDVNLTGYDVLTELDRTVAVVVPPRVLEEEVTAEAAEMPTEPELVGAEDEDEDEEDSEE